MTSVSLALGGGGVKGISHIGVIRCLEDNGFTIKSIAGTSVGALVGSVYAAGFSTKEIEDIIGSIDQTKLFRRDSNDGPSLLGLHGVTKTLSDLLGDIEFDDLKIPFACTSVDILTSQEIILMNSRVVDSVLASIAVPGIFPPRKIGQATLVDGGVLDPVPVSLARWLEPTLPTIAVCLSPQPEKEQKISLFQVPNLVHIPFPLLEQFSKLRITQAFNIFIRSLEVGAGLLAELRMQIDQPDIIIRPEVGSYQILEMINDPGELISLGEIATQDKIVEIHESFKFMNRISRIFRSSKQPGKTIKRSP